MVTKKVILKSPSRLKANANLKSALVDWAYGFGYDKTNLEWISAKRRTGNITRNKTKELMLLENNHYPILCKKK